MDAYSQKEFLQSSKSILHDLTYWFLIFSNSCGFCLFGIYFFQNIIWKQNRQCNSLIWSNRAKGQETCSLKALDLWPLYHWVSAFCTLLTYVNSKLILFCEVWLQNFHILILLCNLESKMGLIRHPGKGSFSLFLRIQWYVLLLNICCFLF